MTTPPADPTPGEPTPPGPQYGGYGVGSYPVGPPATAPYSPPPSRAMAIWALVLGWIPCLIGMVVSVVFSIIVLNRGRDGRNHGEGFAIGGLVGVGFWVVLVVVLLVVSPFDAERDSSGHLTSGGDVTIDGLRVGDCGTKELDGITRLVHVVPCTQSHVFEVMATFEMRGSSFPGDDTVKRLAEGGCLKRLARVPGLRSRGDVHVTYLHPISRTWSTQRTVVCMANTDQPVTGAIGDTNS